MDYLLVASGGLRDHEPVELKEITTSKARKGCVLLPALAVGAVVVVAMLATLVSGVLPVPDGVAFLITVTPEPAAPLRGSVAVLDGTPAFTYTPSPTATVLPPTPTPVPPTPTCTPTHTPTSTATPTPLPPPTPPAPGPPTRPPIVTREQWGAMKITEGYRSHTVDRITIHHDGTPFYGGAPARLRGLQSWSRGVRGWVDIPYHFLIDLEGNIYEGRPLEFVGDTATEYDPTGHALITVMGNYDLQEINQAQLGAIVDLASWLCYEYSIPARLIGGHRDYAATSCPGASLYLYLTNGYIASAVEERLQFADQ